MGIDYINRKQALEIVATAEKMGIPTEVSEDSSDEKLIDEADYLIEEAEKWIGEPKADRFLDAINRVLGKKKSPKLPWKEEGLPIPGYVDINDVPEFPPDLTIFTDEEVRRLHSTFNAYFVRTSYLASQQENHVIARKFAYKQMYNKELLQIDNFFREGNRAPKEKTKQVLEAEIFQNQKVVDVLEEVQQEEANLNTLKTLRDIYENNCTRLSREMSMRESEKI